MSYSHSRTYTGRTAKGSTYATSYAAGRGQITLTRGIRKAAVIRPGGVILTRVTAPGTVEVKALPTLRLAPLLDRYRITRPVDEGSDRDQWQAEAAGAVLGRSGG